MKRGVHSGAAGVGLLILVIIAGTYAVSQRTAPTVQPSPSAIPAGISGTVLIGPVCPVVRVNDPSCDDRPYQGQFIVRTATGTVEVARFVTDANGRFLVALAPGTYLIEPVEQIGISKQSQSIEVRAGTMTELTLTFDTGIR